MTREEAITVLNMVEAHGALVIEAKKMAIEALKQPERFTYDEMCIFLSAIEKERRAIKRMKTYIFGGDDKKRLDCIVDEIERKVKAALWKGEE